MATMTAISSTIPTGSMAFLAAAPAAAGVGVGGGEEAATEGLGVVLEP